MTDSSYKLSTRPVGPLFAKIALPITLGLLINGLYNLVDAYFVTNYVNVDAMGGIGIIFPLQMLIWAVASMVGSGAASIIARLLGAKNNTKAQNTLAQANTLSLVISLFFTFLFMLFLPVILKTMGTSEALYPWAIQYGQIILFTLPIAMFSAVNGDYLRAEGKSNLMAIVMLLSSVLNILFDAIFIVGFDWQVKGAAWATVLAQFTSILLALFYYGRGKTFLSYGFAKLDLKTTKQILIIGFPSFTNNAAVAISVALAIRGIAIWSEGQAALEQSAYSLLGRVMIFVILPLVAMMIANQTLAGFNFGAQLYKRVKNILVVSLIWATLYSLAVTVLMVFYPQWILAWFTDEQAVINTASHFSALIFFAFWGAGFGFIAQGFFQAIGRARISFILTLAKSYLVLVPLIIILPYFWGVTGIFLAFPIADFSSFIFGLLFLTLQRKRYAQQN